MPNFRYTHKTADSGMSRIKVTWQPYVDGNPGSHFYVQYKKERETQWVKTEDQLNENSIVVKGLDPGQVYSFRVVAVDGAFQTPSRIQDVHTYAHLPAAGGRGQT